MAVPSSESTAEENRALRRGFHGKITLPRPRKWMRFLALLDPYYRALLGDGACPTCKAPWPCDYLTLTTR